MLPVVWNNLAKKDVRNIFDYIRARNPSAAKRLVDEIENNALVLSEHPNLYRMSQRIPGCREIAVHTSYIIVYKVEIDCVRIVRVVHSSRMYF